MKKQQRFTLLLAGLLLFPFGLASCTKKANGEEKKPTETTLPVTTAPSEEDLRSAISDDLPDMDFDGYTFRIYGSDNMGEKTLLEDFCPTEQNGDVINDAVYNRNKTVEERFNCKIVMIDSGETWDGHTNAVKRIIMAGDDAFDLTLEHVIGGPNNSLEQVYINLYDVPHLNFEKPWWPKQTIEELSVLGQMYLGSNDMFYTGLASTKVVYVNKDKLADYDIPVPYQAVFDGTWTMDKLITLTKDVYEDVNGNGERDNADFYGYVSHSVQNGFLVSCEVPIIKKSEENVLELDVNADKLVSLVEKVYDWYFTTAGVSVCKLGNDPESGLERSEWEQMMFRDGHALFAFEKIGAAVKVFRDSDVVYGILPQPKFDENQENYRAFSTDYFFCVPTTTTNLERTGVIIEALSAEGYKQIIPSYYETALKNKFLYDDESVQILDLINSARTVSFAYIYDNWEGFGHLFSAIFGDHPTKDYSSFYASREKTAQKRLNKIITAFEDGKG